MERTLQVGTDEYRIQDLARLDVGHPFQDQAAVMQPVQLQRPRVAVDQQ